jgi:hypothetical protein
LNDNIRKKPVKKQLFQIPWKYREGFVLALILLLTGFFMEIVTPRQGISIPSFPFNMYAGLAFITTISFLHIFYRDDHFVKWLSTMPAATTAIILITMLTIVMGVLNQSDPEAGGFAAAIGLTHLKNSWPFLMAQLYVLVTLGLVILRRSIPFKKKNTGFILNHAGLWIIIAAASLGTGDLRRLRMELHRGEPVWYAFDKNSQVYQLPFALELINFDIEEYPPQLAIVDSHTGYLSDPDQTPLPHIIAGKRTRLLDWEITIEEFFPSAMYNNGEFTYSEETGAPPFAKVTAVSSATGESHEGWISCGSFMFDAEYLWLDGRNVLVMTVPEPRRYLSNVLARTMQDEPRTVQIEVNKPPRISGWRLYQMSYDQSRGKWSEVSVLEIVKDPWLPMVYLGFVMLFAGAVHIFWIGKKL